MTCLCPAVLVDTRSISGHDIRTRNFPGILKFGSGFQTFVAAVMTALVWVVALR
jgi:hypothetical protein